MIWRYSYKDLELAIRLKFGYDLTQAYQNLECLSIVAANIFGGGSSKAQAPKNKQEALSMLSQTGVVGGL